MAAISRHQSEGTHSPKNSDTNSVASSVEQFSSEEKEVLPALLTSNSDKTKAGEEGKIGVSQCFSAQAEVSQASVHVEFKAVDTYLHETVSI